MTIRTLFAAAFAGALTLVAVPDDAAAYTGYVCETQFIHSASYGNHGSVYVAAYSEPNCAGTWVIGALFCTTGGTSSLCEDEYEHTSPQILTLIENLRGAAAARQKVNIAASSRGSGRSVTFFSN